MLRGPADRGAFPPSQRVDAVSIATSQPADYGCHATRWSLDEFASTILNQNHAEAMSRSTIWRILDEGDLKPHKIQYWLNSHDPDFEEKARDICTLYVDAPRLHMQWFPDRVSFQAAEDPEYVDLVKQLTVMGHRVAPRARAGDLNSILVKDGMSIGAADEASSAASAARR